MADTVISVRALTAHAGAARLVHNVTFDVAAGEVVALFGPSGAGKTTIAMAVAGIDRPGVTVSGDITAPRVGYLPQQAAETLNPARRIGRALGELAGPRYRAERRRRVESLLRAVAFDGNLAALLRRYPHEFSGGQRTRLALAQVLATEPAAIVLDEPTAGLDSLSRAALVDTLGALGGAGVAMLLVTHDPVVVERLGGRTLRVRDGTVHPDDAPAPRWPPLPPPATGDGEAAVRLSRVTVRYGRTMALAGASVDLPGGATTGIVGPSGAGKSTIARCIAGLVRQETGTVIVDGEPVWPLHKRNRRQLADVQYLGQEAASSFDARRPVLDQVAATAARLRNLASGQARAEALDQMTRLGLTEAQARRYPPGLSGGQLQRAALVRALLAHPRVLLCDEITTGLDHALAQQILDHVDDYRKRTAATVLQISHDLRTLLPRADRIVVVDAGRIVETTTPGALLAGPRSETAARLTRAELSDVERDKTRGGAEIT